MIEPPERPPGWLDGTRGLLLGLAILSLGAAIGALLALAHNAFRPLP